MTTPATLPRAFWNARPELAAVRAAAVDRLIAPDAVLGAVLAHVSAELVAAGVKIETCHEPHGLSLDVSVQSTRNRPGLYYVADDLAADLWHICADGRSELADTRKDIAAGTPADVALAAFDRNMPTPQLDDPPRPWGVEPLPRNGYETTIALDAEAALFYLAAVANLARTGTEAAADALARNRLAVKVAGLFAVLDADPARTIARTITGPDLDLARDVVAVSEANLHPVDQ